MKGIIRNPKNWEQSGWGLLNEKMSLSDEIVERRADYMSYWLDRSRRFLELLRALLTKPSQNHPPLLYLYAKGTPTLASGIWMGNDVQGTDSLFFDNREPTTPISTIDPTVLYEDGDETVTIRSSSLPSAYRETFHTTLREYKVGHVELVTRTDIQEDIVTFLNAR